MSKNSNPTAPDERSKKYRVSATATLSPQFRDREAGVMQPNATDFKMHAEVDVPEAKHILGYFGKRLKFLVIIISVLWAYVQYLEQSCRSRIDHAEQELRSVTDQLSSSNSGVRAIGVRTLYSLAFKELPAEPVSTWYAPPINLVTWLFGKRERRLLDRSRDLFREFAAAPRLPIEGSRNPVSTAILKTAIEWIAKEHTILEKDMKDPSLWFFYKAKLDRAYAPGSNLEDIQFSDADLSFAILNSSNFSSAYMEGSNLKGANLESAILTNINLIRANLQKANLNFAKLESAKLQNADLTEANLTLAQLGKADLTEATMFNSILRTTDLQETVLKNSDLRGANFSGANLRGADFSGADLRGADLRFANGIAEVKSWAGAKIGDAKFPNDFEPPIKETQQ